MASPNTGFLAHRWGTTASAKILDIDVALAQLDIPYALCKRGV